MKKLILVPLLMLFASTVFAQTRLSSATCPGTGCVVVSVRGQGSIGIQITDGTPVWVGTIQFEQTIDGITWTTLAAFPNGSGTTVTSATDVGYWTASVAGGGFVRIRFSAYTSGIAIITTLTAPASLSGSTSITGGDATAANQTTMITSLQIIDNVVFGAGTGAAALRVTLPTDGTGVIADITNPINVICDSGCAGGTQFAVDDALGATPTGTLAIAIRDDALSALTPVEGDAIGLRVDANGALWTRDDVLEAAISGSEMQVDVVAALPAGTNAIGKLAANTGVDI